MYKFKKFAKQFIDKLLLFSGDIVEIKKNKNRNKPSY